MPQPDALTQRLHALDSAFLTPMVQRLMDHDRVTVTEWEFEPLTGGLGGRSLYRFQGTAASRSDMKPWALILKIFTSAPDQAAPDAPRYWKREPAAYGTGFLLSLPDGVRAPRFIAETHTSDTETWLWLSEGEDETSSPWSLDQYGKAACHFGLMQGAYLTGTPLPEADWLSRHPLAHWTADADAALRKLIEHGDHPVVQHIYPPEAIETTTQLCKNRLPILKMLRRMPQTLCHQDVFRRNLFMQTDHTLAVDWEMAGIGAAGEDLAGLVSANLALREVDPAQGDTLDEIVFSGYMNGLHEVGWQGDADLIRFGYTAASALRYGLCLIEPFISIATDEDAQAFWTRELGCTLDELFEGQAKARALWGRHMEEAMTLMAGGL